MFQFYYHLVEIVRKEMYLEQHTLFVIAEGSERPLVSTY